MGSWQVVSVNCPRAAYNAEGDDARLFAELKRLMDVAVEIFKIKRRWMDIIRAQRPDAVCDAAAEGPEHR